MKLSYEEMSREELIAELKSYAADQTSTEIYKSLIRQRNVERDRADRAEAALAKQKYNYDNEGRLVTVDAALAASGTCSKTFPASWFENEGDAGQCCGTCGRAVRNHAAIPLRANPATESAVLTDEMIEMIADKFDGDYRQCFVAGAKWARDITQATRI